MSNWLPDEMKAAVEKLADWQCVAVCLYGEARSEPIQGIVAVASVIQNRIKANSWFGKDWREVVLKPYQFSMWHPNGGQMNYTRVLALAQKLAAGESVTEPKWLQCAWTARGAMGGFLLDNTRNATHYHTATLTPRPKWAQGVTPVCQIGGHVFYNKVK